MAVRLLSYGRQFVRAADLRARAIGRRTYGHPSVKAAWAPDLWLAIGLGCVAALLCLNDQVRDGGPVLLLAATAIGAAILATVLTALSVVATFFDSAYRRVLEEAHDGDLRPALEPYAIVAYAAAATTILALVGAVAWKALPGGAQAVVLGASMLAAVWSIAGAASLVEMTLFHARNRASTMRAMDAYREAAARQRGSSARSRTTPKA